MAILTRTWTPPSISGVTGSAALNTQGLGQSLGEPHQMQRAEALNVPGVGPLPPTPGLSSLPDCPPIPSFSINPFILWLFDSSDHPGLLRLSLSMMTGLMGLGAQAVVSTTPLKAHWVILWFSGVSLKETQSSPEKEGDHPLCPHFVPDPGLGSRHSHTWLRTHTPVTKHHTVGTRPE